MLSDLRSMMSISKAAIADRLSLERLVNVTDSTYVAGADVISGLSKQPKTLPAARILSDSHRNFDFA
jgi:hypothetical protein